MAQALHLAGRDHRPSVHSHLLLLLGLSASFFYFYNGGMIVLLFILAIAIALGVVEIAELINTQPQRWLLQVNVNHHKNGKEYVYLPSTRLFCVLLISPAASLALVCCRE